VPSFSRKFVVDIAPMEWAYAAKMKERQFAI
jgi:hypothetical protein